MAEVDLEALAAGYDHRPPAAGSHRRARRAAEYAGLNRDSMVLDIGGGRGVHAGVFAETGARVVLTDRSIGMAGAAGKVAGVQPVIGDMGDLPFRDAAFDLSYFHLSLHYGDWSRNLAEAVRVTRRAVWVWTLGSDHHRNSFLARWFPSVVPIDESRFPEPADVAAELAGLGMASVGAGRETEKVERTAGDWRAAAEARFVSTLQLIPPEELSAGLRAFDQTHPDPTQRISYELRFSWVRAEHPSLR